MILNSKFSPVVKGEAERNGTECAGRGVMFMVTCFVREL